MASELGWDIFHEYFRHLRTLSIVTYRMLLKDTLAQHVASNEL